MPLNFTKPSVSGNYSTDVLQPINDALKALAQLLDPAVAGTLTSTPTGAKRLNAGEVEQFNGSSWATYALNYLRSATPVSYGSIAVAGTVGGFYGTQYSASAKKWTFMVDASGVNGLYNATDGQWNHYWDATGKLAAGEVPWARLSGQPSITGMTPNAAAVANTVAVRDGSGYLFGVYLNQSSSNSENPTVGQVMVTNGSDGYLRKSSIASFSSQVMPSWGNVIGRPTAVSAFSNDAGYVTGSRSISAGAGLSGGGNLGADRALSIASNSNGYGVRTVSTSAPSGAPADGDMWLQYE